MDGWDLVFRTGRHTDAKGNTKVWTTDDLDRIVNSFNPSFHEPPVVIGHPSDNAPAFGWVDGVKRVGNDLYLQYRDVADEFKEWVGKGLFKKKSIALYPDGSLRHVGYLGAMPPAIKGLPNFQFADGGRGEAVTYEFGDWADQVELGFWRRLKNWVIGEKGRQVADELFPEFEMEVLARDAYQPEQPDTPCCPASPEEESMKPEEVQALIDQALAGQAKMFSEQLKGTGEAIKGLTTQIAELGKKIETGEQDAMRREFHEFLMTPAMQKRIPEGARAATAAQMMTLVGAEPVMFEEGGERKTISALDEYKKQLQALPEVVAFGEHASKERVGDLDASGAKESAADFGGSVNRDRLALHSKALAFMETEAGKGCSYDQALIHVSKQ
ncbi:hypothetical protein [Geobacter sp.]|uniref:hypothetical protein n=1 Tax=Geobacter sp. TaxID=46610 RepID=UPI002616E279|nr:hypothetical protein [Geobacter sp.]